MAAQPSIVGNLLGPPEIYSKPSAEKTEPPTGDSFIDLMDTNFNSDGDDHPPMGLTENASPTFISTGNPLLDFFFHVVPYTPKETITSLLSAAWDHEPLTALKLILHLRGVRGTGKSDRKSFYTAALWLHLHHPKTLALNLPSIVEFGYFKDLPQILHLIIDSPDTRKLANCHKSRRSVKKVRSWNKEKKQGMKEEHVTGELALAHLKLERESVASLRFKKRNEMASRAVNRYNRDPHYRFIHDRVSEQFAIKLAADIAHLAAGELGKLSLAAKWCPSLDSCFDRSTLICESISRHLFPRESDPNLVVAEDAHYVYRIRGCLRRALVTLRRALQIPEVFMSAGQWDSLPYARVPSVAMKNYKGIFQKHDDTRFNEYLAKVREGTAKIAAGALLPHEILAPAAAGEDDEVAELQWQRMVADMAENGRLQNCIAVCDVSGSMYGTPMEVCVALGLLVSELSDEPWKGRVFTFSENPQLHKIEGKTLKEKMHFIRDKGMEMGMNTDLQKVFDRLLQVAIKGKLVPEKMIKRVFIFSDMEFDAAGGSKWETDYEVICRKFKESGYESAVPEIVFWNLRSSRSTPVTATKPGVALVSGFSKNLMKIFLEGGGVINPMVVMETAIAGEEYKKLTVFD